VTSPRMELVVEDQPGTSTSASEKTSAVNASMVASLRQQSTGRPLCGSLLQKRLPAHANSTGTCGSNNRDATPAR